MRKAEGPSRGLQRAAFKLPFITNLMVSHCCLPHLMPLAAALSCFADTTVVYVVLTTCCVTVPYARHVLYILSLVDSESRS